MPQDIAEQQNEAEDRDDKQRGFSPLRSAVLTCWRRRHSLAADQTGVDRSRLALLTLFDFKADPLTGLGSLAQSAERLDVHEDFLPALGGLDEAESAFIVPGFDCSVESHSDVLFNEVLSIKNQGDQRLADEAAGSLLGWTGVMG